MSRLLPVVLVLVLGLSACADVGEGPRATLEAADAPTADSAFAGTALPIDTTQSRIEWHAAKVTRTHDGGFEDFTGTVYLAGTDLTGVELTIDAASIWSDSDRLTGHLQSPDFFEVETYPEATFRADTFEPVTATDTTDWAEATHRVGGVLTMRGQSRRITFPARIEVADGTVTADANFIIDRQEWGLSYPGAPDDLIQDEVRVMFHVVSGTEAVAGSGAPPKSEEPSS